MDTLELGIVSRPHLPKIVDVTATPVRVIRPVSWTTVHLGEGLARLAQYGDLFQTLTLHRLSVRYKHSLLGPAWAVLQPLSLMVIFTVVFTRLVRMPSDGVPYGVFTYAGLLAWTFFSTASTNGTTSLVSHAQLVTKVYFPREILPATYVAAALVDLAIALAALLVLLLWFRIPLTVNTLAVAPALLVLAMLGTASALVLAASQAHVRDIGAALPLVLQVGMFATPVLYPLSAVPARWYGWYVLNPLAGAVDGFRRATLGLRPDFYALGVSAVIAAIALPLAYALFKRTEATLADVV
jgi:lipopolysaccharide transport system permease protein